MYIKGMQFPEGFPQGHFYSPLPNSQDIRARAEEIFSKDKDITHSIDLNEEEQLRVFKELAQFAPDFCWPKEKKGDLRFFVPNLLFDHADSFTLYAMLRLLRPQKVIEVGSGFSSALMLDTDELYLQSQTHFTFIEPDAARLKNLLKPSDEKRVQIREEIVQKIPPEFFAELNSRDILFIDSSHVSKVGSDVNYLIFEVLPRLKSGVVVHFHDIGWPFEYPQSWVEEGRAWNEAYLIRAFLQYNGKFKILHFNSFMSYRHLDYCRKLAPCFTRDQGGSLWLQKL